jgi:hypothetical protein
MVKDAMMGWLREEMMELMMAVWMAKMTVEK